MDKLQMAHEWAMKALDEWYVTNTDDLVDTAWKYADAMQAEADKRNKAEAEEKRKQMRELLNAENTFIEKEGQHFDDVNFEVDWDLAPIDAVVWRTVNSVAIWIAENGRPLCTAPTFGCTGTLIVERPHDL